MQGSAGPLAWGVGCTRKSSCSFINDNRIWIAGKNPRILRSYVKHPWRSGQQCCFWCPLDLGANCHHGKHCANSWCLHKMARGLKESGKVRRSAPWLWWRDSEHLFTTLEGNGYGEETRVIEGVDTPAPEPKLIGVRDSDWTLRPFAPNATFSICMRLLDWRQPLEAAKHFVESLSVVKHGESHQKAEGSHQAGTTCTTTQTCCVLSEARHSPRSNA